MVRPRLRATPLGPLLLPKSLEPGRPAWISAASSLLHWSGRYWCVADDEQFVFSFRDPGDLALTAHRLVEAAEGDWPLKKSARKKRKRDFEAAVAVPRVGLVVLGSGSRKGRRVGYVLRSPGARPRAVDLAPLYRELERYFDALNVEGAAWDGNSLWLAQRGAGFTGGPDGNAERCDNALIELDAASAAAELKRGCLSAASLRSLRFFDLGRIRGVRLSFTDLCFDEGRGRLLFSATAENTHDPVADGACEGSAVGALGADGRLEWMHRLPGRRKVEGLCFEPGTRRLLLVDDQDDQAIKSLLRRVSLPGV